MIKIYNFGCGSNNETIATTHDKLTSIVLLSQYTACDSESLAIVSK